jgi:hypothetical protein
LKIPGCLVNTFLGGFTMLALLSILLVLAFVLACKIKRPERFQFLSYRPSFEALGESYRISHQPYRPRLEALEIRVTPAGAVNVWNNLSGDGLWSTGRNWTLTHSPASDETATFNNTSTANVDLNVNATIYGLDIQNNWGATSILTLDGRLEVTNLINQNTGKIGGGNTLTFDGNGGGAYTWTGGTRQGTDPIRSLTIIASGAVFNLSGAGDKTLDTVSLRDAGTTTWSATSNIVLKNNATWDNTGGVFTETVSGAEDFVSGDSNTAFIVESGATFTHNAINNGDLGFQVTLNMAGTLNVQNNHLYVGGSGNNFSGTTNVNNATAQIVFQNDSTLSGANFQGVGTTTFEDGTITISGAPQVATTAKLESNLGGTGNLTLTGSASWLDGDWNGTGTTTVGTGGTLTISRSVLGNPLNLKGGWGLTNNGTVNLSAAQNLQVDGGSNITNNRTFNILGGNIAFSGVGTVGTFTNAAGGGLFGKGPAGTTQQFAMNFTNAGNLELDSGTLEFLQNITQTAGQTYLTGGNLKIDGTTGFTINAGKIMGSGTITAALVDNGGAIDQSGLGAFQTLNIMGAYRQEANGYLIEKITKTNNVMQFDRVVVSGQANLGGGLTVIAVGNYTPVAGDRADILDYGSRVGDFDGTKVTLPQGMSRNPQGTQYWIQD